MTLSRHDICRNARDRRAGLYAQGKAILERRVHRFRRSAPQVAPAFFGAWFNSRFTWRTERICMRIERRAQIFDEACRAASEMRAGDNSMSALVSRGAVERKIARNCSPAAHSAWLRMADANLSSRENFNEAQQIALDTLAKELAE